MSDFSDSDEELQKNYSQVKRHFDSLRNPKRTENSGSDSGDDEDKYKVCLKNVPVEVSDAAVRKVTAKFGDVNGIYRMNNAPYFWFIKYANDK